MPKIKDDGGGMRVFILMVGFGLGGLILVKATQKANADIAASKAQQRIATALEKIADRK